MGTQSIDPREMRSSPSLLPSSVTSTTRSAESTASGFDGWTVMLCVATMQCLVQHAAPDGRTHVTEDEHEDRCQNDAPSAPGSPDSGPIVHTLADLLELVQAKTEAHLEEVADQHVEGDAWIDWKVYREERVLVLCVGGRGLGLQFPFPLKCFWSTLDELDELNGEVTDD